ncbi:creatininase family protein [Gluconobacter kondonii]|uniref:Creatinine amidohydrolase n=1 Tax=Gluconobacter kondonii TaxID=941463 RepID=A0ABQ5WTQ8_9PROT|nr:creatininase family protein [Gluconobacter kondonii]MCP1235390.1 creatininase family protein [Gluconobacter kondonii]GBR31768.1 creatininase [Gluconobacter kondonii NBRC 3266]GLQ66022.1 creatinine amidohydrolase [Gluconobacter kondonii]
MFNLLRLSCRSALFCAGIGLSAGFAQAQGLYEGGAHCTGLALQAEFACRSWTEVAQDVKAGTDTVIIPVGGTEQSGPYIAVGKHNVRAQVLADMIAVQAGHTLVAPVVAYVPEGSTSPRTSHMKFPGTISVPPAVFEGLLKGAAESFRVQGFRRIVLLGDHGGYQSFMAQVTQELNRAWKGQAAVLYVRDYYEVVPHQYADALRAQGYGAEVGLHAELSDTSLMLAVDPSLVRQDALRKAPKPGVAEGVYGGDPRRASAGLGRIGTDMQIRTAVAAIQSFQRSHP